LAGAKVRFEDLEGMDWDRPLVVVANHQSWFDVFALAAYLPAKARFVAKEELGRIPIFGRAWKACGHISVDRSDRKQAVESLQKAGQRVREELKLRQDGVCAWAIEIPDQTVQPVVAIQSASLIAHLHQPRPDVFWPGIDCDRQRGRVGRIDDGGIAGHDAGEIRRRAAPALEPTPRRKQYRTASASAPNRMAATGLSFSSIKAPFVPIDWRSGNGNHGAFLPASRQPPGNLPHRCGIFGSLRDRSHM
jgi:1-acyl-sn-glycerol-3-phosphate acyltransferase